MNYSFIQLFNVYRQATKQKKRKLFLKYSQHTIKFVSFLLKKGLISGLHTQHQQNNKIITIFIKYDSNLNPSISDFSLASKTAFKAPMIKKTNENKQNNFVLNLESNNGKYSQLLARIR